MEDLSKSVSELVRKEMVNPKGAKDMKQVMLLSPVVFILLMLSLRTTPRSKVEIAVVIVGTVCSFLWAQKWYKIYSQPKKYETKKS